MTDVDEQPAWYYEKPGRDVQTQEDQRFGSPQEMSQVISQQIRTR